MCKIWDLGFLFIPAGAEGCGALTYGRVGSEVKSNTNKVQTLIMAFMDVVGTRLSVKEKGEKERVTKEGGLGGEE